MHYTDCRYCYSPLLPEMEGSFAESITPVLFARMADRDAEFTSCPRRHRARLVLLGMQLPSRNPRDLCVG
jgi:hypothetical protein